VILFAIAFVCAVTATVGFWLASGRPASIGAAVVVTVTWLYSGDIALVIPFAVVAVVLVVRQRLTGEDASRSTRELIIGGGAVLTGYVLYEAGRVVARGDYPTAHANALSVIDFERATGLFQERRVQAWMFETPGAEDVMMWLYAHLFLGVVLAALLWLFFTDSQRFRKLGIALGTAALLTVITVRLFPVAPPRLTPEAGIVDTFAARGREITFVNQYAAVPSLHVGWLAACGIVVALSLGKWWGWFALIPAALMTVAVTATGNHLIVDYIVGVIYVLAPLTVMELLARRGNPAFSVHVHADAPAVVPGPRRD
jgi:hypothetical protein